jgi:hemophore-related protein
VDAALHAKAPDLAANLDANAAQKAEVQRIFDQPIDQRRAELERRERENPEAAQQAASDPHAQELRQKIQVVADSCHDS